MDLRPFLVPTSAFMAPSIENDPRVVKIKPACQCGNRLDSVWVSPKAKYTGFQFLVHVFIGVSGGRPQSIEWACRRCNEVIARSTDPELILHFRHE